jgi:hypothetical protein
MRVSGNACIVAVMAAFSGCPAIIYDHEIQKVSGTPVADGWLRVDVPGGPPLSVEIPQGSLYEPVYSDLDTRADDSVVRKRHPAYLIRTLKIVDGDPLSALMVTFLWIEPEMQLLSSEELSKLDRSVASPGEVSRIFLQELWYTRRRIQSVLGPKDPRFKDDPRFEDLGLRRIGGRPARCFAFLPADPNEDKFWYDELCLVAVSPASALIIKGTFHPEGQALEKTTVWPRLLESVRFPSVSP